MALLSVTVALTKLSGPETALNSDLRFLLVLESKV